MENTEQETRVGPYFYFTLYSKHDLKDIWNMIGKVCIEPPFWYPSVLCVRAVQQGEYVEYEYHYVTGKDVEGIR